MFVLERYCQDIHNDKIFTYTLIQKHMLSVFSKDEVLSFSFLSDSVEKVKGLVAALDKYITISSRGKTEKVLCKKNFFFFFFMFCYV